MATLVLVFVAASCGSSGLSREDAIQDMVDEGVDRASANCMMDEIEDAGFTADDGAGDDVSDEFQEALSEAFATCVTDADIAEVLDDVDLESVRQQFIDSFTETGQIDEAQANCIMDAIDSEGVTLIELSQAGAAGGDPELEAIIADATVSCLGG